MSGNEETETLKSYAFHLFENSLVNGLPQIVQTSNIVRRILKIAVLAFCSVGFVYQTMQFMDIFFSYPSVVDIIVEYPDALMAPAVTFCNSNSIKRTKFCEKFPNDCESPPNMTNFCKVYPHYCIESVPPKNFKMPKPEVYDFESRFTFQDMKEMGHSANDFAKNWHTLISRDENILGPFLYPREIAYLPRVSGCYSLFSRVNSSSEPQLFYSEIYEGFLMSMVFNFQSEEYFRPDREPGGILTIHSPFVATNPYKDGFFMRPGKHYTVHVSMVQEQLLPSPYATNCTDYTQRWFDNGKRGPRNKRMCFDACKLNISLKYCNCSLADIYYPSDAPKCQDFSCLQHGFDDIEDCFNDCKEDCNNFKFTYDFQERYIESPSVDFEKKTTVHHAEVHIFNKERGIITYKSRPQYQDIEAFSYLGGYVGTWLGISLIAVLDFLETLILMFRFCFHRLSANWRNRRKSHSSADIEM